MNCVIRWQIATFLLLVVPLVSFAQKRKISLVGSEAISYVIYKNNVSIVKLSFPDVIREIGKIKSTKWFDQMDAARKKRIQNILTKLQQQVEFDRKQSLHRSSIAPLTGMMWNIENPNPYYQGDSLMITLIKTSIGASLLLEGKATVWQRKELRMMDEIISLTNESPLKGDSCSFYFLDGRNAFFVGSFFKNSDFVTDNSTDTTWLSKDNEQAQSDTAPSGPLKDNYDVYTVAERMPDFPGGNTALNECIKGHLNITESRRRGVFLYQFIVEPEGTISNVKIIGKSADAIGDKLIEAIKRCPGWIPGMQNNQNVRVRVIVRLDLNN
jgi:hypothetical protein